MKKCDFCKNIHNKDSSFCTIQCKNKQWYQNNKEHKKQYYKNNKSKIQVRESEYTTSGKRKEKNKKWYNKSGKEYYAIKRQNIDYKLTKNLRTRLWKAVKSNQKSGSAIDDLGCSINEFKVYMIKQFTEGMTWDNYGEWHIDHIKPLSSFNLTIESEFKKACHYTNLQPLWAIDNILKSDKVV